MILEVEPPQGVYWSYSLGNPWWETIHYGRHQSSLNAHQAVVDSDGLVRVVVCGRDPGVANWLDTAGFSNGAMILRCVRTDTAPIPSSRVVAFDEVASALPTGTARITADPLYPPRLYVPQRFRELGRPGRGIRMTATIPSVRSLNAMRSRTGSATVVIG